MAWTFFDSQGRQRLSGIGETGATGATGAPGASGSNTIIVGEQDGTPRVLNVAEIKFSGSTVTDQGAGIVLVATVAGSGSGGAPTGVDYLVGTADAGLSAEIVVGTTPGGELGGTWASPTIDATHAGSAHTDFIAKAIVDAKGDLIVATAADTVVRFGSGSHGQVLTIDSGSSTGFVWSAAASGSLTVNDEGTPLATSATTLDFVGTGVTATGTGAQKTITIPGGSGVASPFWWHSDNAPGSPDAANDEFADGTVPSTRVNSGTAKGTWAELLNGLEWTHTVTGATELDVYAIARTISVGDYVTIAGMMPAVPNFLGVFVGFANGTTFGTSNAVGSTVHSANTLLNSYPGFNTRGADGTLASTIVGTVPGGIRVKYEAANTWGLYMRQAGGQWRTIQTNYAYTMTPTHIIFGVNMVNGPIFTTGGGSGVRLECFRVND